MPNYSEMVTEFHEAMGLPVANKTLLDVQEVKFRLKLIVEEFNEVVEALSETDAEHALKELTDLVYVLVGTAVVMGWDFEKAFELVHKSNMTKFGRDGKPVFREDGKPIKSELYVPPDLKECI